MRFERLDAGCKAAVDNAERLADLRPRRLDAIWELIHARAESPSDRHALKAAAPALLVNEREGDR
ncbi:hypothetical protein [Embleya sp. NBC_00896]|uniref:hypothetical protein n=1 Tax=Embleya sp. NBC_00896 TaxID=2975961 RepID=UPI003865287F|nr:hypothetical protein OG928_32345 [Embleya sp. NBC_00896]